MRRRAIASFVSCAPYWRRRRGRAGRRHPDGAHNQRRRFGPVQFRSTRTSNMAKTFRDLMAESRQSVPEWTPDDVRQRASNGGGYTLIDVREKEEYREGHLPGAV